MYKLLRQKRGATLVVVLIVATVLTVLSLILVKAALSQLVLTQRDRHIDYTYYANHSAIDVCFKYISGLKDIGKTNLAAVDVSDPILVQNFADNIVNLIKDDASIGVKKLNRNDGRGNTDGLIVDVLPDVTDKAKVLIKNVTNEGYELDLPNKKIKITIGIEAESNFRNNDTYYSAGNKITYAEKEFEFEIPIPNANPLEAAIYTVGDLYVSSDSSRYGNFTGLEAKVKGDVNVFGSYSHEIKVPEQYFYGGIYAINQARLDIVGNAYTRSFIRTGPYIGSAPTTTAPGYDDGSSIHIYRDAIAQCIQGFGNNDKIVVYRNSYTFDDIELNGQNSVIAVNGSAFGLTRQAEDINGVPFPSNNHDSSSAIVNSAPLHNMFSDDSMKSRIVVNGDILLAGGTFKIDTVTGETDAQIEDASLAWDTEVGLPAYKIFEDWTDQYVYHKHLRNLFEINKGGSFLNLFQLWNTVPSDSIDVWLANIDSVRGTGTNDYNALVAGLKNVSLGAGFNRDKLSGLWWYELSANGKLYNRENPSINADEDRESSLLYMNKNGDYAIDNIYKDVDSDDLSFSSDYWFVNPSDGSADPLTNLTDPRFVVVKNALLQKTHIYATREYPKTDGTLTWEAGATDSFSKLLENLRKRCSNYATNEYVAYKAAPASSTANEINLEDFYEGIKATGTSLYTTCASSQNSGSFDDDKDYYLIVNEDAELSIVISGAFNGILVTAGKVILTDGANVRGSIVAAGGGTWSGDVFTPKLNTISNDAQAENSLDKGVYAGVKFLASGNDSKAQVDFYLGLDSTTSLGLQQIRDKASVDSSVDEDNEPLNKAARINLLNKFSKNFVFLQDIF